MVCDTRSAVRLEVSTTLFLSTEIFWDVTLQGLDSSTFVDAGIAFFQKIRKHQQHSVTYQKTLILSITIFLGFVHHIVLKNTKQYFRNQISFNSQMKT
jgi:hypothetical protein